MKYTGQEWFKTRKEMALLFADRPETLSNTMEVVDKIVHLPTGPKGPFPKDCPVDDVVIESATIVG